MRETCFLFKQARAIVIARLTAKQYRLGSTEEIALTTHLISGRFVVSDSVWSPCSVLFLLRFKAAWGREAFSSGVYSPC